MFPANVLLHITGSISCYKACYLASMLVQSSCTVQITASRDALQFVGKATFEGICRRPVLTDMFDSYQETYGAIPHITLPQSWADILVVYPASANTINRLVCGLCDDLFGALCLANNYKKPLLIAPAMNDQMLENPATQHSLSVLKEWGAHILESAEGHLACGTEGRGRLVEPQEAFDAIQKLLQRKDACASS